MFCAQCGTRAPQAARFCEECGAALQTAATAVAERPYDAPPDLYRPSFAAAPAPAIQFNPTINVSVAAPQMPAMASPMPSVATLVEGPGVPLVLRAVWFVLVGLWLGLLWLLAAWALNVTIIGLPLGLAMINRAPQVMTLRSSKRRLTLTTYDGRTFVLQSRVRQAPFVLRALYFLAVGVWLSLIWMLLAWLAAALILTLPLSFWMFDRLPAVTTLHLSDE